MNVDLRETPMRRRALRLAYTLGIVSGTGWTLDRPDGWRITHIGFRGRRTYILGVDRDRFTQRRHCYRSQIAGHGRWHRYSPTQMLGDICGVCCPWPCCGATGEDHAADCPSELDIEPGAIWPNAIIAPPLGGWIDYADEAP